MDNLQKIEELENRIKLLEAKTQNIEISGYENTTFFHGNVRVSEDVFFKARYKPAVVVFEDIFSPVE